MARAQQEFTLTLYTSGGVLNGGQTVELNRGASTVALTEQGTNTGVYKVSAIDVGQWRVVVNSTPTNRYVAIGAGELDAPDYTNNPNSTMTTDGSGNPQWSGPNSTVTSLTIDGVANTTGDIDTDAVYLRNNGTPVAGNIPEYNADTQQLQDSGKAIGDMAETVGTPTTGNLAEFDANGNIIDSGVSAGTGGLTNRIVVTQANHTTTLATIDSTKEYLLDGVIDVGSMSIEIPAGGISITGLNFDISKLTTSQASHTLFTSPVGGSGNILLKGIGIEVTGTGSQVYDVVSDTGFEAYEISQVNFNNCTSLGTIDNYRQGFEQGTGRFGGTPELTLKGTWDGGYYIDSSIVRSLTDGSYYLFKAGTAFSMSSRFRSNQNIDLNATVGFFDFSASNFPNENTIQLEGCIVTRNGVVDPTDSTIIPNISRSEVECFFKGNTGIRDTHVGGKVVVTTEQATSIGAGSTWYDLNATWTASGLQHFSSPSNGELQHDGVAPIDFQIFADLSIKGTANNVIEIRLGKWTNSTSSWSYFGNQKRIVNNHDGSNDIAFFTLVQAIFLQDGDKLKVQVRNNNGNANVTALLDSFLRLEER